MVSHQKSHYGHDENIGWLNISPKDRLIIAEKLRSDISFERVLDGIWDQAKDITSPLNLLYLKDIHNIKRDFGLFDGRYDPNDFISVEKLVEHLRRHASSPKEFQLEMLLKWGDNGTICLDATHGTNGYKYQLTSIFVVDEFGNGRRRGNVLLLERYER